MRLLSVFGMGSGVEGFGEGFVDDGEPRAVHCWMRSVQAGDVPPAELERLNETRSRCDEAGVGQVFALQFINGSNGPSRAETAPGKRFAYMYYPVLVFVMNPRAGRVPCFCLRGLRGCVHLLDTVKG
jgi:hypothetical protein